MSARLLLGAERGCLIPHEISDSEVL
jgi:hypothetical protein